MSGKKIVIIGGVAGGASTAARLRRMDEHADILMVERGPHISFANCGLPYYIGGVIADKRKLVLQTPEAMMNRFRIKVMVNTEAVSINRENRSVKMVNKQTGEEWDESYDDLVLSPGAEPLRPPIPGIDSNNIFTLRNVQDTLAIAEYVESNNAKNAVVVGGGFIGIEIAENLRHKGLDVALVEMADQVMPPFDKDMAAFLHREIREQGVDLNLEDGVSGFQTEDGRCTGVMLKSGKILPADIVMLSIGVRPENSLARDAGLEIGSRGGIVINDKLKTADPHIYALGDATESAFLLDGDASFIPLAGPANKQGRILANVLTGNDDGYRGSLGTSVVKVFSRTAASTGYSEKVLKQKNLAYLKSYTHSASHAGYYPGAEAMAVKLLFEPETGKVLGAQIVGGDGVEKRIDVIATAIYGKMTVFDLTRLELSYAPPFSSAKDPVNMAGYVAENILKGKMKVAYWHDVADFDLEKIQFVDVSTSGEYKRATIPGARNIPVDDLRDRLGELDLNKPVVVFCQVGLRGYIASRILMQNGFKDVRNLSGSYRTWSAAVGL